MQGNFGKAPTDSRIGTLQNSAAHPPEAAARWAASLVGPAAAIALLLGAVGVYAVVADAPYARRPWRAASTDVHLPSMPFHVRERVARFWARHRTVVLMVHSAWALAGGTVVVVLARERYHLVPWVVLFLAAVWASTLYFGRAAASEPGQPPGLVHEVASYITRVLYQETLFFLLPFYAYSTVAGSPNVVFLLLLGGLAVLSCLDVLFDRWLRTWALFALTFFAIVAFAAINLLLPLLAGLAPRFAVPVAAVLSVAGASLLAVRTAAHGLGARLRLGLAAVVILVVTMGFPALIPPVPLRLERATFAAGIDQQTLALRRPLPARAPRSQVDGVLVVVFEVFSPTVVPAMVRLEWQRDGATVHTSRDVAISAHAATAHTAGFRVWDSWRPASGQVPPGRYRVVLETSGGRIFGVARLTVE